MSSICPLHHQKTLQTLQSCPLEPVLAGQNSAICQNVRGFAFCGDAANECYLHCEFHFTCKFCLPDFATPRSCFSNLHIIDFTFSPPCVLRRWIQSTIAGK